MKDAFGQPQSVLLLGATSDIGQAILSQWRPTLRRVILAGRPSPERDKVAATWVDVPSLEVVDFDSADIDSHHGLLTALFDNGDIDVVVLAFGVLGDQAAFEREPAQAAQAAITNYAGAVSSGLEIANLLEAQGHGTLVVLSSVAGERARRSNFVYGSTKAGLDSLAQGIAARLQGSGASVVIVRPGFVRTAMTEGLQEAPLAVDADDVAVKVAAAVASGREVVYVPGAMRLVMSALRHVPTPIFRKLPI